MTVKKKEPSLQAAYNLDQVVQAITFNRDEMTKTKLRNQLGFSDEEINEALALGCGEKILRRGMYNSYTVKKTFNITEERFYPAVKNGLKKLWALEKFHENEYYLEETARRDSKISGRWTRPDFTIISHKKFPCKRCCAPTLSSQPLSSPT